jgi:hypothetical protein
MNSMRLLFYPSLLLVSFLSLGQQPTYKKSWESSAMFANPYGVIYDDVHNVLYVSNMNLTPMDAAYEWEKRNDGFISKLSASGEVIALKWIEGLADPAGMYIKDNRLFITDDEFLVIVDIERGKIIKRISAQKLRKETPASLPVYEENSKASGEPGPPPAHLRQNKLISVTGAPDGSIFILDAGYKSIYKWKNNQLTHMMDNDQFGIGAEIIWNEEKEVIWIVTYGSIISILPDDKYKSWMTRDIETENPIIGIAKMKNFYLLVTNADEVYRYQYSELTEFFRTDPCKCHTDIEVANEEILVLDSRLNKLVSFKPQ